MGAGMLLFSYLENTVRAKIKFQVTYLDILPQFYHLCSSTQARWDVQESKARRGRARNTGTTWAESDCRSLHLTR